MSGRMLSLGPDDLDYGALVDRSHPEAQGLVSSWLALPGYHGGLDVRDIIRTNHGTYTGVTLPGSSTSGKQLGTLRRGGRGQFNFDGSNDYVNMGNVCDQTTNACSWGAWFINLDTSSGGQLINKRATSAAGYDILVSAGGVAGTIVPRAQGTSGVTGDVWSGTNDSQWHHIMAVLDRPAQLLYTYADGRRIGSGVTFATAQGSISTTQSFQLGARGGLSNAKALLDDVRVYSRALSAAEVAAYYQQGLRDLPGYINRLSQIFYSFAPAPPGGTGVTSVRLVGSAGRLAGVGGLAA